MKYLGHVIAGGLISLMAATATFADTTIFLTRHAEKQDDGTRNPPLSEAGTARAQTLADRLAGVGLKMVYSTDYKRTQETAAPTAAKAGLTVTSYDPRALKEFAASLKGADGPILVVGHSNTTPYLASLLSGKEFPMLEEHQYDHLYKVVLKDGGIAQATISYIKPRSCQ